jgi:hypothetical protein
VNLRQRRREALLFALRGFRLLRQHYLTLVSAAIITGLGVVAMRSDAFSNAGRAPELPAFVQSPPDGRDIGLQYAQSIISSPPAAELGLRSIVYFIYESDEERDILERGLSDLSRARFKLDSGGPEDTNIFVRAATPAEAAAVEQELTRAEALARAQGYSFQVVDLRSAAYN